MDKEKISSISNERLIEILEKLKTCVYKAPGVFGICSELKDLELYNHITLEEYYYVDNYLFKHKPKGWIIHHPYWFAKRDKAKRIDFLEGLINNLKNSSDE